MLSCGVLSVKVIRRPRVGILPTGSEIVEPGERIEPGNIIDCNSYIAEQLVCEWGGESHRMAIVRNEKSLLMRKIAEAVKAHDIVVVIAGTSAGSEDLSLPVLKEMGEVLVHGVDLMPGKPAILGRIDDTPVIGLPGYPVSAYVVLDIFVREAVAMALGTEPAKKATTSAVLEGGIPSKLGMDEIVRIKLRRRNGTLYAIPLKRGAGVLKSVVEADGFIHIPKNEEGLIAGSQVTVELITDNF
jgi:putative molybdopterin biosynthesis protein